MVINHKTGCWIRYQLNLSNITYATVGYEANRSVQAVCDCIRGYRNSQAVEAALCKLLGYSSTEKMVEASRGYVPQRLGGAA